MRWGSLLLCAFNLGVSAAPWVTGRSDLFLFFLAGMNLQSFLEGLAKPADEVAK